MLHHSLVWGFHHFVGFYRGKGRDTTSESSLFHIVLLFMSGSPKEGEVVPLRSRDISALLSTSYQKRRGSPSSSLPPLLLLLKEGKGRREKERGKISLPRLASGLFLPLSCYCLKNFSAFASRGGHSALIPMSGAKGHDLDIKSCGRSGRRRKSTSNGPRYDDENECFHETSEACMGSAGRRFLRIINVSVLVFVNHFPFLSSERTSRKGPGPDDSFCI